MHALRKLVIKPTVFCFHKCPYCDLRQDFYSEMLETARQTAPQSRAGHIPLPLALRQIDDAYKLGMRECLLSGGDPLLYPHLRELIEAAHSYGDVFVFMNSVGTHLSEPKALELLDAGLGAWNFSVDTLDPDTYDQIRGVAGAFRQVMAAFDLLRSIRQRYVRHENFWINFMTVITRHNFRDLPKLISFCLANGVASIFLMNVYGDDQKNAFLLSEKEIHEFRTVTVPEMLAIIDGAAVADVVKTNARTVLRSFYSQDNSDANYAQGIWWKDFETIRTTCQVPNYYALVEADGKVLPCCLVEIAHEGVVGDITKDSLAAVWEGDLYRTFRDERIPFCQRCPVPRHKTLGFVPELCRQFTG
jgi:radical SAM protein with 4Fe4S-binding SPASM domain